VSVKLGASLSSGKPAVTGNALRMAAEKWLDLEEDRMVSQEFRHSISAEFGVSLAVEPSDGDDVSDLVTEAFE